MSPREAVLSRMPPTFQAGGFDCGVLSINAALEGELQQAMRELRVSAWTLDRAGQVIGFMALRNGELPIDSIDRTRTAPNLTKGTAPVVHLELVAVQSKFQRQGYGEKLLEYAIDSALEVNKWSAARFLSLDATPAARDFYERNGFFVATIQPSGGTTLMLLDLSLFAPI